MADYRVIGELAIAKLKNGTESYQYRGAVLKGELYAPEQLAHLVDVKLIEEVADAQTAAVAEVDPQSGQSEQLEREAVDVAEAARRAALEGDTEKVEAPVDLDALTIEQLKVYADERGIDVAGLSRKGELVEKIGSAK